MSNMGYKSPFDFEKAMFLNMLAYTFYTKWDSMMYNSNISNEIYTFLSENDLLNIGILLAIISILLAIVIYILDAVRTRKKDKKNEKKEDLRNLIISPDPGYGYSELYTFLHKHHENDIKKDEEYRMVDANYFRDNMCNVELTQDEDIYKFPILFKKKWLRSYNKVEIVGKVSNC